MISRLLIILFVLLSSASYAQVEGGLIREGNSAYEKGSFEVANESYRAALEKNPLSAKAMFNLGDAQFRQSNWEDAQASFEEVIEMSNDKLFKSKAHHNIGNIHLQKEEIDLDAAIESYKNALRNNPKDTESRYNLAYAMALKKKKEEQEKNQDQNEDQDKKDEEKKDQEEEENKEEGEEEKKDSEEEKDGDKEGDEKKEGDKNKEGDEEKEGEDGKESDEKGDEKKEGENGKESDKKGDKNQAKKAVVLSREEANRLLETLEKEEKKVQQKMMVKQKSTKKKKLEKDW